jgi:hypothetical protein
MALITLSAPHGTGGSRLGPDFAGGRVARPADVRPGAWRLTVAPGAAEAQRVPGSARPARRRGSGVGYGPDSRPRRADCASRSASRRRRSA